MSEEKIVFQCNHIGVAGITDAPEPEPVLVVGIEPDYWTGGNYCIGTKSYIDPTKVWRLPVGTKLYTAPPAPSAPDKTSCLSTGGMTVWGDSVSIEKCNNFVHLASQAAGFKDELINTRAELADLARDAARLDWLDERNAPHGLGWELIQMPAGNVHIHTLTVDKAKFGSIREAIDAAIEREILGGGNG